MNKPHIPHTFAAFLIVVLNAIANGLCADPAANPTVDLERRNTVTDIELRRGGVLTGQVFDAKGAALANSVVQLNGPATSPATTATNDRGEFGFQGLRGGLYELRTAHGRQLVRLWTAGTAPPTAVSVARIEHDQAIMRGQGPMGPGMMAPPGSMLVSPSDILFAAAIGAGIVVPLAVKEPASP